MTDFPTAHSVIVFRRQAGENIFVTVFWPHDGIKNVGVYGDKHSRNFGDHKTRPRTAVDQAFSALLDDLETRRIARPTLPQGS